MSLISLNKVSLRYGVHVILDCADLVIQEGDRLALSGHNGCGKTTLLKILSGELEPDAGLVERSKSMRAAYLQQDVPNFLRGTVYDVIASGLGELGNATAEYSRLYARVDSGLSAEERSRFDEIVHLLNESDAWGLDSKIRETIKKLELSADMNVETASAGLKRRVLLGREIVCEPDILLLDEPTNHLDIDSVKWLESFLMQNCKSFVFVSHDRTFLQNLATRVVEVDRGSLISFDCDFKTFIDRRDELLKAMERNEAVFDKKLAQEEAWLRQGIKARRTRNEGRVRELMRLRKIRQARRSRQGDLNLSLAEADASGEKVFDVKNLRVSYDERLIIDDFSTTIFSGDKIGIIGRNGIGKTTLLNAILGKIKPTAGEIEYGTRLQVAHFDQLRASLDMKISPFDFVGDGADFVTVAGQKQNIMGYLQNFLFSPEQIRGTIGMLSGGECNRLVLAKLFTNPANVLVLDEPTNDLDVQTIEVLESALVSFKGTILLVSHDRSFLNNIVTGIFFFDEGGKIRELVGGYDEWEAWRSANASKVQGIKQEALREKFVRKKKEKFTNRERAELDSIPEKISELDAEAASLSAKLQDPVFLRENVAEIATINARIEEIERLDAELFARWEALDARRIELEG